MVLYENNRLRDGMNFESIYLQQESFPLHFHRAYEFIYVEDGSIDVKAGGKLYSLQKSDAMLILQNQYHEYLNKNGEVLINLFNASLVPEFVELCEGKNFRECIFRIKQMPEKRVEPTDNICVIKSYVYSICGSFLEQAKLEEKNAKTARSEEKRAGKSNLLREIITYVEENYKNECTLITLSEHLGYDYAYLSKFFKKQTGINFIEHVNQMRISHACELLTNTNMPISEISAEVGYNSIKSFDRNFLSEMGKTPKKYRMSKLDKAE